MTRENEKGRWDVVDRSRHPSSSARARAIDRGRRDRARAFARVVVVEDARRESTRRRGSMARDAARHRAAFDDTRRRRAVTRTERDDANGANGVVGAARARRGTTRAVAREEARDARAAVARVGTRTTGTRARARGTTRARGRREKIGRGCGSAGRGGRTHAQVHGRRRDVDGARRRRGEDDDARVDRIGRGARTSYDGVFALLFLNFALFACDHWGHMSFVKTLYRTTRVRRGGNSRRRRFVTPISDLSSNIFFLYIFGKLIEEEEERSGCGCRISSPASAPISRRGFYCPRAWAASCIGGAATVSLGASGAVFGLFAVSVLVKLSWNWRRLLEVVILGQFVVDRFLSEAKMIAAAGSGVGAGNVNHVAISAAPSRGCCS